MKLNPVVAGIDHSFHGSPALMWAAADAAYRRVPLRLVHCVSRDSYASDVEDLLDACLNRVLDRYPDLAVTATVAEDPAARGLLTESRDAAVLVVGKHRLHADHALLLGSTATDIAAHATCPTVVVPEGPQQTDGLGRMVVVAVDGSAISRTALEFGFAEAQSRGISLTAVHVDEHSDVLAYARRTHSIVTLPVHSLEKDALSAFVDPVAIRFPDVEFSVTIQNGPTTAGLLKAGTGAELMVIGDTGLTAASSTLLGSVALALLERVPCPLAVVHE
ncbi:MAG TPA: universal stress protein [Mycobacteriales bacterium]|nr:universal stress protein [Mycobacteriales bacterium]